jgi:hypothetical protein
MTRNENSIPERSPAEGSSSLNPRILGRILAVALALAALAPLVLEVGTSDDSPRPSRQVQVSKASKPHPSTRTLASNERFLLGVL